MKNGQWMGLAVLLAVVQALCGAPAAAQPGGGPDALTRYDETDFPGNDLDDLVGRARSFDDCAQRCMADDRCGAFTFNLNDRNCIPKSSGASAQRNARAMSGVVNRGSYGGRWSASGGAPRGVTRYAATDFPGNDIGDMVGRTRSFDDCADRCLSDGRCNAFTYNLNDGNCIPKSGSGGAQRNERADSGTVNRAGAGPRPGGWRPPRGEAVTRYDNTDFPGNDLGDMAGWARNYDDCARRCLDDDRCAAFTYNLNNRICIPKSAALDRQRNDRADSGVVNRR